MEQLQTLVNDHIGKMIEDGTVERMIRERAEETIVSIINDSFRSYGKLATSLKEKIEESIDTAAWKFEIEPYTNVIGKLAQEQIAKYFEGEARMQLNERLGVILKPVPKEITLQELVTEVANSYKDDDYDNDRDDHLSFECNQEAYGWYDLKFWKKKETNSYLSSSRENEPDIHVHVNSDGEITWLNDGKRNYGAHNHGIEAILYRMSIKQTKITDIRECNQHEFEDTYIGIGEDY